MSDQTLRAQIDAARAYEELLVPALFGQWSPKIAEAGNIRPGQRVLDVGCGTGSLTREIASRVRPVGHVAGIDPSPGMLALAQQLEPAVEWHQGVAEQLPFPSRSFDAVVSQFALMFFTDRHQALREMLRVLAPGGRLAIAVWDQLESMPAYATEVALLERMAGREAADALRAPFELGDTKALATLLSAAGIHDANIDTRAGTAQFPDIRTMVAVDLRGWLPLVGVDLSEERIDRILGEAEQALSRYTTAHGRVAFPLSAHLVSSQKRQAAD